ncbi:MAG: hypothetical protein MUE44_35820 [Oscillatoriaceae cyanobacterium Prado104]|jgi:hypothetical protein|nr:hypothetical protein [Oscillatoriaceae cyanobacterium Prado104]
MKKRSPLTITISLAILATTSLPIVAQQSKRYPTENQLQQLMNQFRNFVASPPEGSRGFYLRDPRNAAQSRDLKAFVRAWLPVNPDITPFIGQWTALEETTNIYPSSIRGRACIIETFIPPPNGIGISFAGGTISGKQLRTSERTILVQQGNYLGVTFINTSNDRPGIYEYAWPKPPVNPAELMRGIPPAKRNQLLNQFKEAGCTHTLPQQR